MLRKLQLVHFALLVVTVLTISFVPLPVKALSKCQYAPNTLAQGKATIDSIYSDTYSEGLYSVQLYVNTDKLIVLFGLDRTTASKLGVLIGQNVDYTVTIGETSTDCLDWYSQHFTVQYKNVVIARQ